MPARLFIAAIMSGVKPCRSVIDNEQWNRDRSMTNFLSV
jgi:hypothetical protein